MPRKKTMPSVPPQPKHDITTPIKRHFNILTIYDEFTPVILISPPHFSPNLLEYIMRNTTTFLLLAVIMAIPSLYAIGHLPYPLIAASLTASTAILYLTLNPHKLTLSSLVPSVRGSFSTPWPLALLIIALALSTTVNHQPVPTFLPTAWNQLIKPLCGVGLLHLITPLALGFAAWSMSITGHPWPQINKFALTLFTCLLMWPDGAADLPALGLLILSLSVLLTRQRISWPELGAIILLLAVASTARAIFIYLPVLISFSLLAVWPKRAMAVLIGSLSLLAGMNLTLPTFPALNWMDPTTLAGLALLIIVTIQSIYHWRWWPMHQHAAWGIGAPMLVIALHNLSETPSFSLWYGAIYLAPALPVITYTLLRPTYKHT